MYDRRDTGYEECTTGGLQEMRIEEFTTGGVQDIRNARQEGCRARGMHDRIGAGHEECTTGGLQEMRNARHEGCKA